MKGLIYREDWTEARERLTIWWNGGDIGRPPMAITVPREHPIEIIAEIPPPEGCLVPRYTIRSLDYRVNAALRACTTDYYLGEAIPSARAIDIGPGALALYLGCEGVEGLNTVWMEPFITDLDKDILECDPGNRYWQFTLEVAHRINKAARGKFLQTFPDLIEGLDTLASMRGSAQLLIDLIERPDSVSRALRRITDLHFHYYDVLYDLIRDEVGGSVSVFQIWAPGRAAKLQCDISAMISPAMFRDLMVPILTEMTERTSYSLYHWDGPGALCHHEALLAIPRLHMIQWVPTDGDAPCWDRRWWPLYHKSFEAGKKIQLGVGNIRLEVLHELRKEFGERCKLFFIIGSATSEADALTAMQIMES